MSTEDRLSIELLPGLRLASPVLSASGCYGAGREGAGFGSLAPIGALVTKTVTPRPRAGNPPPRIWETPSGMLNSIGLENPGVERFLESELPAAHALGHPIVLNVGGESFDEFVQIVERVQDCGAIALEVNLSCPNVQGGALPFSTDPKACEDVVRRCAEISRLPLFVKLSPNVSLSCLLEVAAAAEAGGAAGLTLINTLLGRAIDWRRGKTRLALGSGGLSGPAIKPVALHCIANVRAKTRLPILGVGGCASAEDVCEFLAAGASAVQMGTAHFREPLAGARIAREVGDLLAAEGICAEDLTKRSLPPLASSSPC